jgi:hypothetical protein
MGKNQLASELASLGIMALVGGKAKKSRSRSGRRGRRDSGRRGRRGSSTSSAADVAVVAYKGKHWRGSELPEKAVRYAELPAKVLMEALHIINSTRCTQTLKTCSPNLSFPACGPSSSC